MDYQDSNQNGAQQDWQQSGAYQNNGQNWNNSQNWSNGNGAGRRLTRSVSNRMVCGVCAGIAEYFNWDPTIVRLVWVGASILFGAGFMGLIAYFIAAVIMPER
ncbi:MAG TPA: PspC domain-containing protein [Candidatus Eisenbergiella pullistercoris]|uniref:PspC domain-containing protein n=1 Tax=Candidatus Eisenbergiella pullistercoris TaxID=2838555 RepID=A0A9D1YS05_9FIRM|nr:PspC domain-containing protein [Candidatus Eisenbergiella pullistercoris]